MFDDATSIKTTLFTFYIAYILFAISKLIIDNDYSSVSLVLLMITIVATIGFTLALKYADNYVLVQKISISFYIFFAQSLLWQTLGSGHVIFLLLAILILLIIVLSFKKEYRNSYIKLFIYYNVSLIFIDMVWRADNTEITWYFNSNIFAVFWITSSIIAIAFINRLFTEKILHELQDQTFHDNLTKVKNSRAFYQDIERFDLDFERLNIDYTLVFLDIDKFKDINDTYGHSIGDEALIAFCDVIKRNIRSNDDIYRIGGDEFIIVFRKMMKDQIYIKMEHIKKKIDELDVHGINIKFSYGVKIKKSVDVSGIALLKQADELMYQDKKN